MKNLSDIEKVRKITKWIRFAEKKMKGRYSFLEYQDILGLVICILASVGMIIVSLLYGYGYLSIPIVIIGNAFLASILHELEHDLIHGLYFKDKPTEKILMWMVWIFRGNTPNPFYRKKIHLHHHKESGQFSDIEEQMIGNGMKYNWKRYIVMFDQHFSFLINGRRVAKTSPELDLKEMFRSGFPILAIFYTMLYTLIAGNILLFLNSRFISIPHIEIIEPFMGVLNFIGVIYLIPNFIRQACLQFISSNMHYFGDVERGKAGVLQQTQVLNPWFLVPFQFFCFNFGSTHGIHHFVVNQPFYLRQMVAPLAHAGMKRYGVRFNDLGTFRRANRYQISNPS